MALRLKHDVYDSDTNFSINPSTRVIKNESTTKTGLIQHDHNSERFTFEMPKIIEGHDMSQCDIVEVHYINIDSETKAESHGYYRVDDLLTIEDESGDETKDMVIFSWIISQHATQYVGHLHFLIRFACVDDNNNLLYVWNTAVHTGMSVSNGIYNSNFILEDYADVLLKWQSEIQAFRLTDLQQTTTSDTDEGENVWTATFADGTTKTLTVKNGSKGAPGGKGATGKSAYDYAKEGGYTGTEDDFKKSLLVPTFYEGDKKLEKVKFVLEGTTLKITTE